MLRLMQGKQNYVWYAVYDEDMIHTTLMKKIGLCEDKCMPHEFLPWRLHHMQAYLHCENQVCLKRDFGSQTLCKIYLLHIEQVKDIVRYKNHLIEMHMQQKENGSPQIKPKLVDLKRQFKIVKASEEYDDEKKSTHGVRASQQNIRTSTGNVSRLNDDDYQNYIVKVEHKREFDDLGDVEY